MAVGRATGDERARKASEMAISSALLDVTIDGARGILFNITGGPDLSLFEVNEAAAIIKESAHPEVNLIFGAQIDEGHGRRSARHGDRDGLRTHEPSPAQDGSAADLSPAGAASAAAAAASTTTPTRAAAASDAAVQRAACAATTADATTAASSGTASAGIPCAAAAA